MLYFDIAIIAGEIAGLVLSIEKHGFWKQFRYYTQWSNYLLFLITVVHLICLVRRRMPAWVERYRYYATCLTTVTILVTVCILIPWYGHPEFFLLETNGLFHHLLCPILAIASLPFLRPMGKKDRDGTIHLSAITSGGSQAMFFKINTFGEQAFLDKLAQVL
jgi:hypothetical protein